MNHYSYQCTLPANVFYEKTFVVLWMWFVVLFFINLISLLKWIYRILFRRRIIQQKLLWPENYNFDVDRHLDFFVYDYLSTEGYLVLMLIKSNTQDWHFRIILKNLWKHYMNHVNDESFPKHKLTESPTSVIYGSPSECKLMNMSPPMKQSLPNQPISHSPHYQHHHVMNTLAAPNRRRLDLNTDNNATPMKVNKQQQTTECKNNLSILTDMV